MRNNPIKNSQKKLIYKQTNLQCDGRTGLHTNCVYLEIVLIDNDY